MSMSKYYVCEGTARITSWAVTLEQALKMQKELRDQGRAASVETTLGEVVSPCPELPEEASE